MASITDRVSDLLAATPPFDALTDDDRAALLAKMTLELYAPGEIILNQGEDVHRALYVVESGLVRLTDIEADRLVDMRGPGATFGSYGLIQGGALPFEAQAAEHTACALIASEAFAQLRERDERFRGFFDEDLKRYVRGLDGETDAQGAFLLFDTTLGSVLHGDAASVEAGATVREAARAMAEAEQDSVVIVQEGAPVGIVTEGDFVEKVVVGDADPTGPVMALVERPPIALRADARLFDAVRTMMAHRIRRVVVTGVESGGVGLLSAEDIAHIRGLDPVATTERLERTSSVAELAEIRNKSNRRLGRLSGQGVQSEDLLAVVAEVDDQLKHRLLALVERDLRDEWGESRPQDVVDGPWAWLLFGAAGRRESGINGAQTNGLVYADPEPGAEDRAAAYYGELAERVSAALTRCGYAPSGLSASQPAFRQPLAAWHEAFATWIEATDADATGRASQCFDLRVLYGDETLGDVLLAALRERLPAERLVRVLARDGVRTAPPISLLGRFDLDEGPDGRESLDLREKGLAPAARLARALAIDTAYLRSATTFDRLRHVAESDHAGADTARALLPAFATIADLHLREQMAQAERGETPTDRLDPGRLHKSQQNLLKESFQTLGDAQKRLRKLYDL